MHCWPSGARSPTPRPKPAQARIKLGWWQEETRRLVAGAPVHPIGGFLASLPRAPAVDFTPLAAAIDACVEEAGGAPLERAMDLPPHARALRAGPLQVASRLACADVDEASLLECTDALADADYLWRSSTQYRREARVGRVPFAVEELMALGLGNDDLSADQPSAPLVAYLSRLRSQAADGYTRALTALPPAQRAAQRHLPVLAALHLERLRAGALDRKARGLQDMLLAWTTARRAMAKT